MLLVAQVTGGTFKGSFAHSPLNCATLSAPGAPITGIAKWHGTYDRAPAAFRPTKVVNHSVGPNGKGDFEGVTSVTINVPSNLASGCASRGGVRSATLTGTITMSPPCGPGGGPISIYPIAPGPLCGGAYDPFDITTGSDGAVWFLNNGSIGRMTTSGAVTLYSGPNIRPALGSLVAAPDGALWFSNEATSTSNTSITGATIGRITTSGVVTVYPMPIDGGGGDVMIGPDGTLWFTEGFGFASGRQTVIGPFSTTGVSTTYPLPSFSGVTSNFVVGSDGNLWFAHANYNPATGFIGRITPTGVVTTYPDPSGGNPQDIVAGPDGALWFTDSYYPGGNSAIGRITTTGVFTNFYSGPSIDPTSGINGEIAAGPDGALWFTDGLPYSPYALPSEIGSIGRITTAGVVTNYSAPGVYDPTEITAGPDGAMWFVNSSSDTIGRITTP